MPRTKRNITDSEKEQEAQQKLAYKLEFLKVDFERGRINSFKQVNALVAPSVLAKEMRMGYDTYRNKCDSPGDFTNNELIRFAEIVDVDINIIIKFVYTAIKYKNKFKGGNSIKL